MKHLIILLLLVITLPIPSRTLAQSEVQADTLKVSHIDFAIGSIANGTSLIVKDSAIWMFQHSAPTFLSDSSIFCGGKIVAWGNVVILEAHTNGDLWYMPSAFCHCYFCGKKEKLIYWGNVNGKR